MEKYVVRDGAEPVVDKSLALVDKQEQNVMVETRGGLRESLAQTLDVAIDRFKEVMRGTWAMRPGVQPLVTPTSPSPKLVAAAALAMSAGLPGCTAWGVAEGVGEYVLLPVLALALISKYIFGVGYVDAGIIRMKQKKLGRDRVVAYSNQWRFRIPGLEEWIAPNPSAPRDFDILNQVQQFPEVGESELTFPVNGVSASIRWSLSGRMDDPVAKHVHFGWGTNQEAILREEVRDKSSRAITAVIAANYSGRNITEINADLNNFQEAVNLSPELTQLRADTGYALRVSLHPIRPAASTQAAIDANEVARLAVVKARHEADATAVRAQADAARLTTLAPGLSAIAGAAGRAGAIVAMAGGNSPVAQEAVKAEGLTSAAGALFPSGINVTITK